MKIFDLTNIEEKGELIIHLSKDNSDYTVTYDNGQMVFENAGFKYIIPKGKGDRLKFFSPDRTTGTSKYDLSAVRTLYRDTTPTDFGISDISDVDPSSTHFTDEVTVGGVNHDVEVIAPTGVQIYINNVAVDSGTLVTNGDIVKFEITAPATSGVSENVLMTIGDISKTVTVSALQTIDIVTDGLIMYYDANNSSSYPGSGTTWTDLSGVGNNATLMNGVGFDNTYKALTFDGVNDYVSTGYSYIPELGTGEVSFTLEGWVYVSAMPGGTTSGFSIVGHASTPGCGIQLMNSNGLQVNFGYRGTSNFFHGQILALNTWYHVVGVRQAGGNPVNTIYINGVQGATSTSLTINNTTAEMQIGWANTRIEGRFAGSIADIKVYNRNLTSTEIIQNFNANCERFGYSPI